MTNRIPMARGLLSIALLMVFGIWKCMRGAPARPAGDQRAAA